MQARPGAGGGIESSIAPCNDVSNLHPTRAQKSRARVGTRGPRVPLEGASPGACRSCPRCVLGGSGLSGDVYVRIRAHCGGQTPSGRGPSRASRGGGWRVGVSPPAGRARVRRPAWFRRTRRTSRARRASREKDAIRRWARGGRVITVPACSNIVVVDLFDSQNCSLSEPKHVR